MNSTMCGLWSKEKDSLKKAPSGFFSLFHNLFLFFYIDTLIWRTSLFYMHLWYVQLDFAFLGCFWYKSSHTLLVTFFFLIYFVNLWEDCCVCSVLELFFRAFILICDCELLALTKKLWVVTILSETWIFVESFCSFGEGKHSYKYSLPFSAWFDVITVLLISHFINVSRIWLLRALLWLYFVLYYVQIVLFWLCSGGKGWLVQ